MGLGDLGQAVTPVAVLEDSKPIDVEWTPADMPALHELESVPASQEGSEWFDLLPELDG